MLGGSVGRGIGLSLHEGPEFRDNEDAALEDGGVYALQVGAADPQAGYALKSAIVHVRGAGPESDTLAASIRLTMSRPRLAAVNGLHDF